MLERIYSPGDYLVATNGNIAPGSYYVIAAVANERAGINSLETGCHYLGHKTPVHLLLKSGCVLNVFGSIRIWRDTEGTFGL